MPKRSESFANQVRKVAMTADGNFTAADIAIPLDIIRNSDKNRIRATLRDMYRSGEVVRVKQGVYRYLGKSKKPEYREIMWRVLRSRRSVTVADLVEFAGCHRQYVNQWLRMLVDRGLVRRHKNGKYQLIKDTVKMPENDEKNAYLRKFHDQKKEALNKLNAARVAIDEAQDAVKKIQVAKEAQ